MPTVFYSGEFRFYFFSREETRKHVHVISPSGEAKIWLEPEIEVAKSVKFSDEELNKIKSITAERKEEIFEHWNKHFTK